MTAPLLRVQHLGLATRTGSVFTDVSLSVDQGSLAVLVGPCGAGRSALLLAVTGRMRGVTGTVELGTSAAAPRKLRAATAVARLADLVEPEGQLSVGESVTERALIDGVPAAEAEATVTTVERLLDVQFDRALLVDQLDAFHRTLLSVVLALVRPSQLVVLDDADRGLDLAEQRRLFDALTRLTTAGCTLLVSTTESAAVPDSAHVVRLPAPGPRPTEAPAAAAPPRTRNPEED